MGEKSGEERVCLYEKVKILSEDSEKKKRKHSVNGKWNKLYSLVFIRGCYIWHSRLISSSLSIIGFERKDTSLDAYIYSQTLVSWQEPQTLSEEEEEEYHIILLFIMCMGEGLISTKKVETYFDSNANQIKKGQGGIAKAEMLASLTFPFGTIIINVYQY